MKTIQLAITGDPFLLCLGIEKHLQQHDYIERLLIIESRSNLLQTLVKETIDVLIMCVPRIDSTVTAILNTLQADHVGVKTLVISCSNDFSRLPTVLNKGIRGALHASVDKRTLHVAVEHVFFHGYYFNDLMSKSMMLHFIDSKQNKPSILADREIEIIEMICIGLTNKEIADRLCLSVRTIEAHRKNISKKTNTHNTAQLVIYAIREGHYQLD